MSLCYYVAFYVAMLLCSVVAVGILLCRRVVFELMEVILFYIAFELFMTAAHHAKAF